MCESADQNKEALKNQHFFADWENVTASRRGTIIGEYQKLDRLQAPKDFGHYDIKNPSVISSKLEGGHK